MRNINKTLAMHVFRIRYPKVYYFDEKQIVQCISIGKAKTMQFANCNQLDIFIPTTVSIVSELVTQNYFTEKNKKIVLKALCMLTISDNLDTLAGYLSTIKLDLIQPINTLERFVTKINPPIFIREPENQNQKTFDFIYIDVNIVKQWDEDRISFIKKNINKIKDMVLEKLGKNKQFKKFGIPLNCLKLSSITLKSDSVLHFILEIKSI